MFDRPRLPRLILVFALLGMFVPRLARADEPHRLQESERLELLDVIRTIRNDETGWIRIHAAEALLAHGYAIDVTAALADEADKAEPEERIGVWRILARSSATPDAREKWRQRIVEAFLDRDGPDRIHALESLAKLNVQNDAATAEAREVAASGDDAEAAFAWWLLVQQGEPNAAAQLATLLESENPTARLRAAAALGHLENLPSEIIDDLHEAARNEPADSPARIWLVSAAWLKAETPSSAEEFRTLLGQLLAEGTTAEKTQAAAALGERGTLADIPALRSLLETDDPDLRAGAAHAILRIDRRLPHQMAPIDWGIIAAYMIGMLLVGWYYSGQVKTTSDYLLGNRTMKPWAVGLSLFATLMSTISYLSFPGEMIRHGPMIICSMAAFPLISLVVGYFLIPLFMRLEVTSAYEILERRLGISVRMLGSTLFLALRLMWMAVIIYATTRHVLIPLLGIDPSYTPHLCGVLGVITVIYTSLGGLRAVVATDVVQTVILFGGAVLTMVFITVKLGGVSAWWPTSWDPNWQPPSWGYDPTARVTLLGAVIATFTWYVCTAGSDQMAIQRYLATRDAKSARRMFNISLIANATVQLFLAFLGFALLAYFRAYPHSMRDGQTIVSHADQLFPQFIVFGLPAGLTGLVIAGLLAAAMSSLSSGLNSSCSVITVDFVERFRRNKDREVDHVGLARWISVAVGAVVVLLSSFVGLVHGNLLELAYKVVNLLVAPLFGLFFMALFVRRATAFGTIVGLIVGLTVVVAINYWKEITGTEGISFLWAMPLSLAAQIVTGMLLSFLPIGRRYAERDELFADEI